MINEVFWRFKIKIKCHQSIVTILKVGKLGQYDVSDYQHDINNSTIYSNLRYETDIFWVS